MVLRRSILQYLKLPLLSSSAGFESSSIALETITLVMLTRPDIQKKVHEELDSLIDVNRLPDLSDKANLPYLTAVLKETLRLASVAPLLDQNVH